MLKNALCFRVKDDIFPTLSGNLTGGVALSYSKILRSD